MLDTVKTTKLVLDKNERIAKLEEENRKLRYELDKFSEAYKKYRDYEKEELADSLYDMEQENKKLKEKIKELEERLDNKEKVNKQLREELGKFVMNNPS